MCKANVINSQLDDKTCRFISIYNDWWKEIDRISDRLVDVGGTLGEIEELDKLQHDRQKWLKCILYKSKHDIPICAEEQIVIKNFMSDFCTSSGEFNAKGLYIIKLYYLIKYANHCSEELEKAIRVIHKGNRYFTYNPFYKYAYCWISRQIDLSILNYEYNVIKTRDVLTVDCYFTPLTDDYVNQIPNVDETLRKGLKESIQPFVTKMSDVYGFASYLRTL